VKIFTNRPCETRQGFLIHPAPRISGHHRMRIILTTSIFWLLGMLSSFAAEGGHDHLPTHAEEIFHIGPFVVTNSMLMVWIVAAFIIGVAQLATRNLQMIPSGLQNFVEWIVESLYNFLEGILGKHLVKRTFWFFATIFVLILFTNWFGLIPGVGTVGWKLTGPGVDSHDLFRPFLRGGNADLNMTAAMALTFTVLWFYWAITENGIKGFLAHIFAPKGKFGGLMAVGMILVFGFVGILEVVSILFRPVALSFRLYGNIFAGENILENMMLLVGDRTYLAWLPPLPFYFLELLVGLVQALVFMLLTAVFLKLICDHGDEHHDEEHGH
jgi:F-type H+-transporting ATPase subunit a